MMTELKGDSFTFSPGVLGDRSNIPTAKKKSTAREEGAEHSFLLLATAYSLPFQQSHLSSGRASRVRFAGRSRDHHDMDKRSITTTTGRKDSQPLPARNTGCDGSGQPWDTPGCPTPGRLNNRERVSTGRKQPPFRGCDGWDAPNPTYRGARAHTPVHGRRGMNRGWTRPTRHGGDLREENGGLRTSTLWSFVSSRDTPGCPTRGPGCPTKTVILLGGGADV